MFLLVAPQVRAEDSEEEGIQSDASLYIRAGLLVLAALAIWEGLKVVVRWCFFPRVGESSRRTVERDFVGFRKLLKRSFLPSLK